MSVEATNIVIKTLSEQGILGALVVLLFISWRSTIAKLIKLVENNTEAMTKNATAIKSVEDVIRKCEK